MKLEKLLKLAQDKNIEIGMKYKVLNRYVYNYKKGFDDHPKQGLKGLITDPNNYQFKDYEDIFSDLPIYYIKFKNDDGSISTYNYDDLNELIDGLKVWLNVYGE